MGQEQGGSEVTGARAAGSLIENGKGVFDLSNRLWAGSLALGMLGALAWAQAGPGNAMAAKASAAQTGQQTLAQQAIPDAPKPQAKLPNLGSVTPGQGTTSSSASDESPSDSAGAPSASPAPGAALPPSGAAEPVEEQSPAHETPSNEEANAPTYRVQVNDVNVPFTVKDSKGNPVAGIQPREVQVYENGLMQHITRFTTDAVPLSVVLVIDQSMTYDIMERVNDSLSAVQGAFTPYDEISVYKYNNGPNMVTDFTGAQSARMTQAILISKGSGREPLMAGDLSGPMSQTTVINNQNFDPNTASQRGGSGIVLNPPKELHTLNDAILAAATALSRRPSGRRRVIYVISDGKEYGSKAKYRDVVRYLQTNEIEVDGTLVGDSSLPVLGFLDRMHLPLTMRDNILPAYATATGGNFDAEFRTGGIERSFAKIAAEVRTRYTLDYTTHEPLIDGKYRKLEVRVLRPGLTVIAKQGYYPMPQPTRPQPTAAQ
ncbi:MAG: VWA domain-containing protein [Acidobacteriaceae bacterium]